MADIKLDQVTVGVENIGAVALFTGRATVDGFLKKVREEVEAHEPDTSTKKGRDAIASLAYKVSQTKAAADKKRLELTADLRAKVSEINELGGVVTTELEKLRDIARRPLTEWEEKEAARVAKCKSDISLLKLALTYTPDQGEGNLSQNLQTVRSMAFDMPAFADFLDEARSAQAVAVDHLTRQIAIAKQIAEQAAELERMRVAQAERDRIEAERLAKEAEEVADRERQAQAERERIEQARLKKEREEAEAERIRLAAEKARLDAEAKAERDRKEAEAKREAEHQAALAQAEADRRAEIARVQAHERAQRDAAEAEAARLRKAEDDRLAVIARQRAEDERREKDAKHRADVRHETIRDLVDNCFLTDDQAGKVFDAIAVGIVANVSVKF